MPNAPIFSFGERATRYFFVPATHTTLSPALIISTAVIHTLHPWKSESFSLPEHSLAGCPQLRRRYSVRVGDTFSGSAIDRLAINGAKNGREAIVLRKLRRVVLI